MNGESKRIVLGVQYDGTPWQGWQTQLNGLTVQDRLEFALNKFTLQNIATVCAGRTDAGVHGLEQVVHFDTTLERDMSSWVRGVNTFLPPSIAVRWATEVTHNLDAQDNFPCTFQRAFTHVPVRAVQQPGALAAAGRQGRLGLPQAGCGAYARSSAALAGRA